MDRILCLVEDVVMVGCIAAAFVCGVAQVVLRYVFNTGLPWTEGLLVAVAVWACMLAGSRAVREGLHVRVEIVADSAPPAVRRWLGIVVEVVCIAFTGVLCYAGYLYTAFVWQLGAVSQEANVPEWLIYGVVPASMACFALRHAQRLWRLATRADRVDEESLDRRMARSL